MSAIERICSVLDRRAIIPPGIVLPVVIPFFCDASAAAGLTVPSGLSASREKLSGEGCTATLSTTVVASSNCCTDRLISLSRSHHRRAQDTQGKLQNAAPAGAFRVISRPSLLCVGNDPALLRTRRLVRQSKFGVTLASGKAEALGLLADHSFDLVLLCYSLQRREAEALVEAVHHASSATRVLALTHGYERLGLTEPDEEFWAPGPAELVRKAADMIGLEATNGEEPPASSVQ